MKQKYSYFTLMTQKYQLAQRHIDFLHKTKLLMAGALFSRIKNRFKQGAVVEENDDNASIFRINSQLYSYDDKSDLPIPFILKAFNLSCEQFEQVILEEKTNSIFDGKETITREKIQQNFVYFIWRYVQFKYNVDAENRFIRPSFLLEGAIRNIITATFTWSIPCPLAIETILQTVPSKKILDLGCGFGYWAKLFQEAQAAQVIAVDDDSDSRSVQLWTSLQNPNSIQKNAFFPIVISSNEDYLKSHSGELDDFALFFSWARSTDMMKRCCFECGWKGKYVFVVGETDGGCTADLNDILDECSGKIQCIQTVKIACWYGLRDYLFIYEITRTDK